MKVGDLVRAIEDTDACWTGKWCGCWFCSNNSTRIGVVIKKLGVRRDPMGNISPPSAKRWGGYWSVLFDVGVWRLYGKELETINESR